MRAVILLLFALTALLCGCSPLPEDGQIDKDSVSWQTLLHQASDLNQLVRPNGPVGSSRLYSSSIGNGEAVLTGEAPGIYGDMDHGSFLSVKEVPGGVEATMLDVEGAGVVTWMWSANPAGDLILEIDGVETTFPFQTFLRGTWLPQRYPFAAETAGGFNLHFPILHEKSCRIAVRAKSRSELGALFYQIAWSPITTDREIIPFDPVAIRQEKPFLNQMAKVWLRPRGRSPEPSADLRQAPGASGDVLTVSGAGIIEELRISAASKAQLSGLYIEIFYDGADAPSVAAPLHLLCGVSKEFENVDALPVTIKGANATLRWPMPFAEGARIRLENNGESEIPLRVSASVDSGQTSTYRLGAVLSNHWKLQTDELGLIHLAGPLARYRNRRLLRFCVVLPPDIPASASRANPC